KQGVRGSSPLISIRRGARPGVRASGRPSASRRGQVDGAGGAYDTLRSRRNRKLSNDLWCRVGDDGRPETAGGGGGGTARSLTIRKGKKLHPRRLDVLRAKRKRRADHIWLLDSTRALEEEKRIVTKPGSNAPGARLDHFSSSSGGGDTDRGREKCGQASKGVWGMPRHQQA